MTDEESGQTTAIRLQRLGVPIAKDAVPSYDAIGLSPLVDEATDWQVLRSGAWFWGWAAVVGLKEPERWVEIGTLFGSVGESVCLAAAAEIEIEVLREAMSAGAIHRYYGISQRWYAEAQGQTILSVGHRLANIVARALMAGPGYPWGQRTSRNLEVRFPVNSIRRSHWIPVSQASELKQLARNSPYASLLAMADGLEALVRHDLWRALEDQRGIDFHRSRSESPFVAMPAVSVVPGQKTISLFGSAPPDSAKSTEFIEGICATSRAAMEPLLPAMNAIREGWLTAMEECSNGAFTREEGRFHIDPSAQS